MARDAAVLEGNSGTTNLAFHLTLSQPSTRTVMVDYATRDVTATAGTDYSAAFGVAIFPPGATDQQILVSIKGDLLNEADETFWLMLTNAVNAILLRDHAIGTILNDDQPPALSISDTVVVGANTGFTNAQFAVSLSAASARTITVDYLTGDGTATAGADFIPVADTLTFVPSVTLRTVFVPVAGDRSMDGTTFLVSLTNAVNATLDRSLATGTIIEKSPAVIAQSQNVERRSPAVSSITRPDFAALMSAGRIALRPLEVYLQSGARNSVKVVSRAMADLRLGMWASTNFIHVEQPLRFTLAVTNNGPDIAGVSITNRLPASATLLSVQASQGTYGFARDRVIFNLGDLATASSATAAITLKFSAAGSATNRAQVSSASLEMAPTNNSSFLVVLATNDPPSISPIADQMTVVNTPTPPLALSVTDTETSAADLIVLASSSNTNLVPDENLIFRGAANNRALIAVPAPEQIGATVITVTVLDSTGGEASSSFNLNVWPSNSQVLSIERRETFRPPPEIERVERAGNLFKLYFNAEAGLPYAVEFRDSAQSDSWQTLTNVGALPAPALIEVSDEIAGRPQRFYRLSTPGSTTTAEMPASAPRINLHFTALPGVSYTVEYSDSLEGGSWQTLTNIGPVSSESTLTISNIDNTRPQRFFRLRTR